MKIAVFLATLVALVACAPLDSFETAIQRKRDLDLRQGVAVAYPLGYSNPNSHLSQPVFGVYSSRAGPGAFLIHVLFVELGSLIGYGGVGAILGQVSSLFGAAGGGIVEIGNNLYGISSPDGRLYGRS